MEPKEIISTHVVDADLLALAVDPLAFLLGELDTDAVRADLLKRLADPSGSLTSIRLQIVEVHETGLSD